VLVEGFDGLFRRDVKTGGRSDSYLAGLTNGDSSFSSLQAASLPAAPDSMHFRACFPLRCTNSLVTLIGRFWVTAEVELRNNLRHQGKC
jgi:hypothetical protein